MDVFYDLKPPRVQGNRQVIRRKSCGNGVPSLNSGWGRGGGVRNSKFKTKNLNFKTLLFLRGGGLNRMFRVKQLGGFCVTTSNSFFKSLPFISS